MTDNQIPLTDPREVRKLLLKVAYGRQRIDGGDHRLISAASSLVNYIKGMADYQGLSGEDYMTMLAYHALINYEKATDRLLEHASTNPDPIFMINDSFKRGDEF